MDTIALIDDFVKAAALAGARLHSNDIKAEVLPAPHMAPKSLTPGLMAVYVFTKGSIVLKVGKVGPNSNARYTSQHYNASSAPSTLAATLIKSGSQIGALELTIDSAGHWIKTNTTRVNFTLSASHGVAVLSFLEAFLQCRLKPIFEGFASQK